MPRNRPMSYGRKTKSRGGRRKTTAKPNPRRARSAGRYYIGGTVF